VHDLQIVQWKPRFPADVFVQFPEKSQGKLLLLSLQTPTGLREQAGGSENKKHDEFSHKQSL
jgi:hypothetical protein